MLSRAKNAVIIIVIIVSTTNCRLMSHLA